VFSTEGCNTQYVSAIGNFLIKERKVNRWYFLTSDYAFGHDLLRVARTLLTANKGTEVGSDLAPTGTTDFSQYITKMKAAKPDLIFHNLAGADVTNFLKQYAEAGMTIEVAGGVIDSAYAWPVGESLRGHFPIIWWHELETPASRAWAARYIKRWGRPPDNQAYGDYVAVHAIAQAIDKAKSTDSNKLVQALEGHTLTSAMDGLKGRPLTFRAWDHQLLQPMYVVAAKDKSKWKDKWDIFQIIGEVPGKGDSLEAIAIPKDQSECKLEPMA
jgi:branched-chain amino acid transport system substrate-binding protein